MPCPYNQPMPTHLIRDAVIDDAPALADCIIDPILATFRGLVPNQCLSWLTKEESATNWRHWFGGKKRDGSVLRVAETPAGRLVGCALAGPQPKRDDFAGELFLLGVLPGCQRQGIGRQLVASVARRLNSMGITSLGVRVLSVNPNRRFYELLDARFLCEEPYDWNGVLLAEAVYVWPGTANLLDTINVL